jgi:hypothetical protein
MSTFQGSFNAEVGTITVKLNGSGIITGSSGTFRVKDIDTLDYMMEIPLKDEDNPNTVATKQGAFSFTCYDLLTNGDSLYENLLQLNPSDTIPAEIDVNGSKTELRVLYTGFKYDEASQMTQIYLTPKYDFTSDQTNNGTTSGVNVAVSGIITTADYEDVYYSVQPNPTDPMPTADTTGIRFHTIVNNYLEELYDTTNVYIKSSPRVLTTPTGGFTLSTAVNSQDVYWVAGNTPNFATGIQYPAILDITRFSALEGSYIGNFFNESYYIYRLYDGSDATATFRPEIPFDSCMELSVKRNLRDVRYIQSTKLQNGAEFNAGTPSAGIGSDSVALGLNLNTAGSKNYNLQFRATFAVALQVASGGNTNGIVTGLMKDVVDNGVKAYAKALEAEGALRVQFKIRGLQSVKPYQCFTFDADTPDKIRLSSGDVAIYRPSTLKYNFKEDTVAGEAYLIGTV